MFKNASSNTYGYLNYSPHLVKNYGIERIQNFQELFTQGEV